MNFDDSDDSFTIYESSLEEQQGKKANRNGSNQEEDVMNKLNFLGLKGFGRLKKRMKKKEILLEQENYNKMTGDKYYRKPLVLNPYINAFQYFGKTKKRKFLEKDILIHIDDPISTILTSRNYGSIKTNLDGSCDFLLEIRHQEVGGSVLEKIPSAIQMATPKWNEIPLTWNIGILVSGDELMRNIGNIEIDAKYESDKFIRNFLIITDKEFYSWLEKR